ncbi:hypothetical protein [Rickettsiella endosymbiont of Miltochrista miniata]|uniref:hypothetical protein n=1 Tax=Rickettsiella endosymbiont of Miltochrista miniata TaxID=3066239 RepID=UPI00313DC8B1
MTEIQAVGLQRRTVNIMDNFFVYIDKLDDKNIDSYQMKLAIRVKEFFDAMNNVGIEEFASLLKKHRFENMDPAQRRKYTDAFDCLVAFIVAKYNERDLLRYFLPKESTIEVKPTLESNSWRIVYWAQLLGYWVRKLFNTQRFEIVNAETANESLGSAMELIKQKLKKGNYFDLQQNSDFKENLKMVVGKFVENRN